MGRACALPLNKLAFNSHFYPRYVTLNMLWIPFWASGFSSVKWDSDFLYLWDSWQKVLKTIFRFDSLLGGLINHWWLVCSQLWCFVGKVYRLKLTNERSTKGQDLRKCWMQSFYYPALVEPGHTLFLASVCDHACGVASQGSSPEPWHWVFYWDFYCIGRVDWLTDWLPMQLISVSRFIGTMWPNVPFLSHIAGFSGIAGPYPKSHG